MIHSPSTTSQKLLMGVRAPKLEIPTLHHGRWRLCDQSPKHYTMIVFYRGLHCPICLDYISELEQKLTSFEQLGITVIAISGDNQVRATQFYQQAHLSTLTLGYGLAPEEMNRWGLYLSKGHFEAEPSLFSEPALFLVKPDGYLYFANIGTHPFSRISFDVLLRGLDYVITHNYPFRGTEQ